MHITMVGTECAPVAKEGGLGDVIHGLSRELAKQGHQVEIVLPKYDCLRLDLIGNLHRAVDNLRVPFYDHQLACSVECGEVDGIRCFLIAPHSTHGFFDRGRIYGETDDPGRFAFFSRAALELLLQLDQQPDIIHCHDWPTALVPVLRWEVYEALGLTHPRICHTLHNLAHQGIAGDYVLRAVGLDSKRLMTRDRLLHWGDPHLANLLKGAIVYANFVNTVSPQHAWEVQHSNQGMGLQEAIKTHQHKFAGILNGIDEDTWNPRTDPFIAQTYDAKNLPGKARDKAALRQRLGLAVAAKPIISIVSRLEPQKGVELMHSCIDYALEQGGQMVLLGKAAERGIHEAFRDIKHQTDRGADCRLELGYDNELAHQIHAGADIIVIPSLYEPCGLTQMIAMRYGVVPVVRRVGGLADTVFDANYSNKAFEQRNGFVFDDASPEDLRSALGRAIRLWFKYPEYFRQLRLNGMNTDHSWLRSTRKYLEIYEAIRE